MDSEGGYRCFPDAPNRIRKPDASFVAIERMPASAIPTEGYPTIPPDLAVEVVSPNDLFHEVTEEIRQCLSAGVRRVWVIDPEARTVEVRRPDGSNSLLTEADELSGEDVVAGFRCKVSDLFPPRAQRIISPRGLSRGGCWCAAARFFELGRRRRRSPRRRPPS